MDDHDTEKGLFPGLGASFKDYRGTTVVAATGPVSAYRFIRIPKDKGEDVGALQFLLLSLELKAILCLQLGPREHQLLARQNARRYSGAGENEP